MSDFENDSDFNDFSSLSSSDEELEFVNVSKVRNSNFLEETVVLYDDRTFFEHFRMSRDLIDDLSERYRRSQYYNENPGQYGNTPPLHQVLIYLWYVGHQTASFRDVADRFDIAISTLSKIIHRVTMFLSNMSREVIQWPNEQEKRLIQEHFSEKGFPNVIGAIDGCHIKIDKPKTNPDSYINRKHYYSIQMQATCDHQGKILDLFFGYPGSVHDSRVFRNSPLGNNLEAKCGRYYILADSGYALKNNLLTPYRDRGNLTPRQRNYNLKHSKNRIVIEHCFGRVKQKFRQLYHMKLRSVPLIVHMIRAACVLHNLSMHDNFELEEVVETQNDGDNNDGYDNEEADDDNAIQLRNRVANELQM